MAKYVRYHGNPEGSVFARIGTFIQSDDGKTYYKLRDDSLNTGWAEYPLVPTPTPTVTPVPGATGIPIYVPPTPTPTPSATPSTTPAPSATPVPTTTPAPTATLPAVPPPTPPPATPAPTATVGPTPVPTSSYYLSVQGGPNVAAYGSGQYNVGVYVPITASVYNSVNWRFNRWSDPGTAYLQDGGVNATTTNPNRVLIPATPYADPIIITAEVQPTYVPQVRNFVNGVETGPINSITTGQSVSIASYTSDSTQTVSQITMSLTSDRVNQLWKYTPTFTYDGSNVITKTESYYFTKNGTYTLVTYAKNNSGSAQASNIQINVTGADLSDAFTASYFQVVGETGIDGSNRVVAEWTLNAPTNIVYSISWGTPAGLANPVAVIVNGTSQITLTGGQTAYSVYSTPFGTGVNSVGVEKYTPAYDNVTISVTRISGGHITRCSGRGYISNYYGLNLTATGIYGSYRHNVRNCTPPNTSNLESAVKTGNNSIENLSLPSAVANGIGLIEIFGAGSAKSEPIYYPSIEPQAYSLNAITNYSGQCYLNYIDSAGTIKSVNLSIGSPYVKITNIACARSVLLYPPIVGSYELTTIPC